MIGCREVLVVAAALLPLPALAATERARGRIAATSEVQGEGFRGVTVTIEPERAEGRLLTVRVRPETEIERDGRRTDRPTFEPGDVLDIELEAVRDGDAVVYEARNIRATSRPSPRLRRGRRPSS